MNKNIENNVKYIWNKMKNHRHGIAVLQGEEREKDAVSFVWRGTFVNLLKLIKRQSYRNRNEKYETI